MSNDGGFTLIELMITVAILGVLAVITMGEYMSYQAKAKQAEAKINLGALGKYAESYKAEYDTYEAGISELGWAPNMITRYRYWYDGSPFPGTPTAPVAGVSYADPGSAADEQSFTACAVGNVDNDASRDIWYFNRNREIVNQQNDVTTDVDVP